MFKPIKDLYHLYVRTALSGAAHFNLVMRKSPYAVVDS